MLERGEICLENVKFESKMKPSFQAAEAGGMGYVEVRDSDGLMILQVRGGSKSNMKKNQFWKD